MTRSDNTPSKQVLLAAASKGSKCKKEWKHRLRQSCLERMRQQSRTKSGTQPRSTVSSTDDVDGTRMRIAEVPYDSRTLVEAEMQLHGVRVVSPPSHAKDSAQNSTPMLPQQQQHEAMECVESLTEMDDDEQGFVMTEDEVIALMEEIEKEWKQFEEQLLEEELYRIQGEERAVWDSIAEYEQWTDNSNDTEAVPCPLCQEANLTTSQACEMSDNNNNNTIVCPNYMDGSCRMRLEARPGLSLPHLQEALATAIHNHALDCPHPLAFEVMAAVSWEESSCSMTASHEPLSRLWATCQACERKSCLA